MEVGVWSEKVILERYGRCGVNYMGLIDVVSIVSLFGFPFSAFYLL
jgi:hypothetical protein